MAKKWYVVTRMGKNKTWFDEQEGIAHIVFNGDFTRNEFANLQEESKDFIEEYRPTKWFADIRGLGAFPFSARKDIIEYVKTFSSEKIAILGGSESSNSLADFLLSFMPIKSVKYFSDKEEAIAWLKNDSLN